jgi:hypothetical protein
MENKKIPSWVWILGGLAIVMAIAASNKKVRTAVATTTSQAAKQIAETASATVAKVKAAINFMQWTQDQKLGSLEPSFRAKVERVLARLKAKGYSPKLDYGWRSVAYQQELVRKGVSKATFSWHNVTDSKGEPMALAADIIQTKPDWNTSNPFWKAVGEAARAEGLVWGGDWTSLKDYPHVQMYPDALLASYKATTMKAIA